MSIIGMSQKALLGFYMELIGINTYMVAHNLDCGIVTTGKYISGELELPSKIRNKCIRHIYANPNKALKKELLKKYNNYS